MTNNQPVFNTDSVNKYSDVLRDMPGMGTKVYDDMVEQADSSSKLNLALALMRTGFGAAGASAKPGESPISTLSRTLLSPLSEAAGKTMAASRKEKMAARLGKLQAEGRISQSSFAAALAENTASKAALSSLALQALKTPKGTKNTNRQDRPMQMLVGGEWKDVLTNVEIPSAPGGTPNFTLTADVTNNLGDSYKAGITRILGNKEGQLRVKPDKDATAKAGKPTSVKQYIIGEGDKKRIVEGARAPIPGKPGEYGIFSYTEKDLEGNPFVIKTGPGGNAELYIPPTAGAGSKAKGVDNPVNKNLFAGLTVQIHKYLTQQGTKGGLNWDPVKLSKNPMLDPGPDFPATRISKINGEPIPITLKQQENIKRNARNIVFAQQKTLKPGQDFSNIAPKILNTLTNMSESDWGFKIDPTASVDSKFIKNPAKITAQYQAAKPSFKKFTPDGNSVNPSVELDKLPMPNSNKNLNSGIGRVVLANRFSPNSFDNTTTYKKRPPNSTDRFELGGGQMAGTNLNSIQNRFNLERIALKPGLVSKLNFTKTPNTQSQESALAGELEKMNKAQREMWESDDSRTSIRQVSSMLDLKELLNKINSLAYASKVQGFGQGKFEKAFFATTGQTMGSFFGRGGKGEAAAKDMLGLQPRITALLSRQLVVMAEGKSSKVSNKDVEQMQTVLPKLGNSENYNAATLKQVTGYVDEILKQQLQGIGYFKPPPGMMERIVASGIDPKTLPKMNNNSYDPFIGGRYPVTGATAPEYSKEFIQNVKDRGAVRFLKSPSEDAYTLIAVDAKGTPLYKYAENLPGSTQPDTKSDKIGYRQVVISKSELGNPANNLLLKFNANKLRLQ